MKIKPDVRRLFVLSLVVLLGILMILVGSQIWKSLSPTDSSATEANSLRLNLVSPTDPVQLQLNDPIVISVTSGNLTGAEGEPNVAELVLNFDPDVLTAVSVQESNGLLALNKLTDNTNGIVTIDLAVIGSGSFPANSVLATVNFTLKSTVRSTEINFAGSTTYGSPNVLDYTSLQPLVISFMRGSNSLEMNVVSPSDTTIMNVGDTLTLAVNATNFVGSVNEPRVATIIINYDPLVLVGNSITAGNGLTGTNDLVDNNLGRMVIDVSTSNSSSFQNGSQLAILTFTVSVKPAFTRLSFDMDTTLGEPNILKYGTLQPLDITFNILSSSSSSVATSAASSISSTSASSMTSATSSTSISSSSTSSIASSVSTSASSSISTGDYQCGALDANGNLRLDASDVASFISAWGRSCDDTSTVYAGCGPKDSNLNGRIEVIDLAYFISKWGKSSCI